MRVVVGLQRSESADSDSVTETSCQQIGQCGDTSGGWLAPPVRTTRCLKQPRSRALGTVAWNVVSELPSDLRSALGSSFTNQNTLLAASTVCCLLEARYTPTAPRRRTRFSLATGEAIRREFAQMEPPRKVGFATFLTRGESFSANARKERGEVVFTPSLHP